MKKLFQMIAKLAFIILMTAAALVYTYCFLKQIVMPCAPIVTVVAVLAGTIYAFKYWHTGALSVMGIILYIVSWLALPFHEPLTTQLICLTGICSWLLAVALPLGVFRLLGSKQPATG